MTKLLALLALISLSTWNVGCASIASQYGQTFSRYQPSAKDLQSQDDWARARVDRAQASNPITQADIDNHYDALIVEESPGVYRYYAPDPYGFGYDVKWSEPTQKSARKTKQK